MPSRFDEFAFEVNQLGDLTEPLRSVYVEALQNGPVRLAIYAPQLTVVPSRHVQPPATYLLMIFDSRIWVGASSGTANVAITRIPIEDVVCVEMGQVLLFCWLKIVFGREVSHEIKIPFNLVRVDLFREALTLMRRTLDSEAGNKKGKPLESLDLDLKFKNVLFSRMRRNEQLLAIAFQPEVRARRLLLLERQVMPPLLAATTDHQFLLVTEEPPASVERLGRSSEIYTYCPHKRIESVIVENDNEGFPRLIVVLKNENARFVITSLFTTGVLPEFKQVCESETHLLERRDESVLV